MTMDKKHNRKNQYSYRKKNAKRLTDTDFHGSSKPIYKCKARDFRKKVARMKSNRYSPDQKTSSKLRFGALNIDGIDLENCVEVERFLTERNFDVSNISYHSLHLYFKFLGTSLE